MIPERGTWGADAPISLPKPLESTEVEMVDFEGFCFTPDGIRVNLTEVDREVMLGSGFGPQGVDHAGR